MLTLLLFKQVSSQIIHYPNHVNETIFFKFVLAVEIIFLFCSL